MPETERRRRRPAVYVEQFSVGDPLTAGNIVHVPFAGGAKSDAIERLPAVAVYAQKVRVTVSMGNILHHPVGELFGRMKPVIPDWRRSPKPK